MSLSPSPVEAPDLGELSRAVWPLALAGERVLPVWAALKPLLPEGLRRGSVATVSGCTGSTSLALALIAVASAEGSWCAAVGVGRPAVELAAAAEVGVALERFALVSAVGGNGPGGWAWTVAALLDAVDVVVTWPPAQVRGTDARRLAARGRERGSVLVVVGAGWPAPVDVHLRVSNAVWRGVGRGHGRLEARRMEVVAVGRAAATRERRVGLWLPPAQTAESGELAASDPLRVHKTAG